MKIKIIKSKYFISKEKEMLKCISIRMNFTYNIRQLLIYIQQESLKFDIFKTSVKKE